MTNRPRADRLAATLLYETEHIAEAVGEHTGDSLLELMDNTYGDPFDGIGPRLGRAGDWTYAVAYGGWPGEFGPLAPVSLDGVHVCLLEYEEGNGKPAGTGVTESQVVRSVSNGPTVRVVPGWSYDQPGAVHLPSCWGSRRPLRHGSGSPSLRRGRRRRACA